MADRGTAKDFAAALAENLVGLRQPGSCIYCRATPPEIVAVIDEQVRAGIRGWAAFAKTLKQVGVQDVGAHNISDHYVNARHHG